VEAATQDHQGSGTIGDYASLEAVRRARPQGPTPTPSEALAGIVEIGLSVLAKHRLVQSADGGLFRRLEKSP